MFFINKRGLDSQTGRPGSIPFSRSLDSITCLVPFGFPESYHASCVSAGVNTRGVIRDNYRPMRMRLDTDFQPVRVDEGDELRRCGLREVGFPAGLLQSCWLCPISLKGQIFDSGNPFIRIGRICGKFEIEDALPYRKRSVDARK